MVQDGDGETQRPDALDAALNGGQMRRVPNLATNFGQVGHLRNLAAFEHGIHAQLAAEVGIFGFECDDTPVAAEIRVLALKERQFDHALHFIGGRGSIVLSAVGKILVHVQIPC